MNFSILMLVFSFSTLFSMVSPRGFIQHKLTASSDTILRYIRSEHVRDRSPVSLDLAANRTTIIDIPLIKYTRAYAFKMQLLNSTSLKSIGKVEQSVILENNDQWINNTFWYPGVRINIQTVFICADQFYGPRCEQRCDTGRLANSSRMRCDKMGNLQCDYGWMGPQCSQVIDPRKCECANQGVCVSSKVRETERLVCECDSRFVGDKCEISKVEGYVEASKTCPKSDICLNGAQCIPNGPQSFCVCPPGFSGQFCEIPMHSVYPNLFFTASAILILLTILVTLLTYKLKRSSPSTPTALLVHQPNTKVYTIPKRVPTHQEDDEERYTTAPNLRRCDSDNYTIISKP